MWGSMNYKFRTLSLYFTMLSMYILPCIDIWQDAKTMKILTQQLHLIYRVFVQCSVFDKHL